MKVVIDTSSLISLVRYYLPFDNDNKLFDFFKKQIEDYEILIIDEVLKECKYTSKKIVVNKLPYLIDENYRKQHEIPIKTENLIPPAPQRFYNLVDNNFKTPYTRNLNSAEFEQSKKEFLESADARIIIFALNQIHSNPNDRIIIVTEESETSNDQKAFMKIPAICKILSIEVMTLPDLLEINNDQINVTFT